jgi:inorganic phosphate transporter, PiT family
MATTYAGADEGGGREEPRHSIDLDKKLHPATPLVFLLILAAGIGYGLFGLFHDISRVGEPLALGVFGLLGVALLIALGFEFVNGFHDTANAVATVIYTHSLPPPVAVVWSGICNFTGVVLSSGAVAYTIVNLLPVDLILQVGSAAGYAMIFALLLAAVVWNLATWWVGIPNSSTHCLIGSIIGVGLANQLLSPKSAGATSGVEWGQALDVGKQLLFSPIIGFVGAAILLLLMKPVLRSEKLWKEPEGDKPPPWGIRSLLVFTCSAVSFAHGGNDGQKGMGLIMLILIGAAPTAFSVNRTMSDAAMPKFLQTSAAAEQVLIRHAGPQGVSATASAPAQDQRPQNAGPTQQPTQARGQPQPEAAPKTDAQPAPPPGLDGARETLKVALRKHKVDTPEVYGALAIVGQAVDQRIKAYGNVSRTPAAAVENMRNDMYMSGDALRRLTKDDKKLKEKFGEGDAKALSAYHKAMESGVRFIPTWVKVAVAIALGMGTMVGWKRIVKTVGEKIGKKHLTYGQGAAAELMAASTILMAQLHGAPVSTTHILSSGVAGTMAANGSGLQWATIRNIASAWLVTLPVAMGLSGLLYFVFLRVIGAQPV